MIAIIYEGVKTEPIILKNIIRNFFSNEVVDIPIGAAYGGNIHDLANILKNGEELDIISVVKEKIKRSASKSKYKDFIFQKYTYSLIVILNICTMVILMKTDV